MIRRVNEKVSPEGYAPTKTGKAYKVFKVKNGKLYPPMVANAGGEDTPIGVWLDAEEGEFAGLSKTGRPQVKSTGSGNLAYRPGWHLGDVPRAPQFDRTNKETGELEFPKDFVWAECDYAMDVDYQPESDEQGYMRTKVDDQGNITTYRSDKYQHSLAGLPKLPTNGYYKYRTNPRPDTVPWVITGQMRVNRLLSDDEVNKILQSKGIEPIHRQGGDKTLAELGLRESFMRKNRKTLDETKKLKLREGLRDIRELSVSSLRELPIGFSIVATASDVFGSENVYTFKKIKDNEFKCIDDGTSYSLLELLYALTDGSYSWFETTNRNALELEDDLNFYIEGKDGIKDEWYQNGEVNVDKWIEEATLNGESPELIEAIKNVCEQMNDGTYFDSSYEAEKSERYPYGYDESLKESEKVNLPGYAVEFISGYLGNGVNNVERETFRTAEERDARVKELKDSNATGIKTFILKDFYHTDVDESLKEGAEGKRKPGYEYIIYDATDIDGPNPIVAKRSTWTEARYTAERLVGTYGNKYEGRILSCEEVPKGRFKVGDDFYGPFDQDYNKLESLKEQLLKEEAKQIWGNTQTTDYWYDADIEEIKSALEDNAVDYDGWSEDEMRDYFVHDDFNGEADYEDFKYSILPAIDKQCYDDVLVLFGDYARWDGSRGIVKVLPKVEKLEDYFYPNYDATIKLFQDETGLYYTESNHDTPMGGTKIYLYSLKNIDDVEKLDKWCAENGDFDPEYDYSVDILKDHLGYTDIKDIIDKGILTPIKDI